MDLRRHLPTPVRGRLDYLRFRIERDWPFLLSAAGFLLALTSGGAELLPWQAPRLVLTALAVVGFAIGLATFGRDSLAQRRIAARITVINRSRPLPPVKLPTLYDGATVLKHTRLGEAVIHEGTDESLDGSEKQVLWSAPFRLGADLRGTAVQTIRERLRDREIVFNGPVVRLGTDLVPATSNDARVLQPAGYYDNICSNHLARGTIRLRGRSHDDASFFSRYVVDPGGTLRALGGLSELANIIEVSTIALTTDDQLVLLTQSNRSGASKQLEAPSGSGSLEPRDSSGLDDETLRHVIVRGMERELSEECNLSGVRLSTRLTGFARWMEYGGKPEFLGVTRLHGVHSRDVRALSLRRGERHFTTEMMAEPIDLQRLAHSASSDQLEELAGPRPGVLDHGSMPLLLCLRALGQRLAEDPKFIPAA